MADGSVLIEAKIDTKQFDKQIEKVESDLKILEKKHKLLSQLEKEASQTKGTGQVYYATAKTLKEMQALGLSLDDIGNKKAFIELETQIEKTTNSLIGLKNQQRRVTEESRKMQEQMLATSLTQIKNIGYNEYNGKTAPTYSLARRGLEGFTEGGSFADKVEIVADKVEDLNDAFNVADEEAKQLGDDLEQTGNKGEKAGDKTGKGFDKGIRSLKRFALGLFGVQTLFSGLSKATSSYLSLNQTTANKLNAIWVALGNALGPIIEKISKWVLKFIGYLNVFLNALGWNVDLTKNMNKNTKAIGGTTKAMKELNNQVYAFDEINKEQKESSSGSGGGGGGTNDFKMPELDEGIVAKLQDIAHWLKENWDWIWKVGLALAGVFAYNKLSGVLGGMGSLASALKILAGIGIVAVGVDLIYDAVTGRNLIEDLKEIIDYFGKIPKMKNDTTKANKKLNNEIEEWIDNSKEEVDTYEKGSDAMHNYYKQLLAHAKILAQENDGIVEKYNNMSGLDRMIGTITGDTDEYTQRVKDNQNALYSVVFEMFRLKQQGKLTNDEYESFLQVVSGLNGELDGTAGLTLPSVVKTMTEATQKSDFFKTTLEGIEEAERKADEKTKYLNDSMGNLGQNIENSDAVGKKFGESVDKNIKGSIDQSTKSISTFKASFLGINGLVATTKVKVDTDTKKLSTLLETLGKLTGVTSFTSFSNTLKRIGLASGGIVYNPGKGVALNNAVVGEATNGPEGVIPMNNAESMDMIGQSVAKHTKINLTINTMLDNRVIAREQKIISGDMDFVTNGRGA